MRRQAIGPLILLIALTARGSMNRMPADSSTLTRDVPTRLPWCSHEQYGWAGPTNSANPSPWPSHQVLAAQKTEPASAKTKAGRASQPRRTQHDSRGNALCKPA
jgi:hypothetical protein